MTSTRAQRTTIEGNITEVEHAATSRMGNPTYRITLDDGRVFLTETDGSIGYAATNYRPRWSNDPVTGLPTNLNSDGVRITPARLTLTRRGRVTDIERI